MSGYKIKTTDHQLTHSKQCEKVCEEAHEYVQEGIDYIKSFIKSLEIYSNDHAIDLNEQIKINDAKNESRKGKKKVYLDDIDIVFLSELKHQLKMFGLVDNRKIVVNNIDIILNKIEE